MKLIQLKNWIGPNGELRIFYYRRYFYIWDNRKWVKKTKDYLFDEIIKTAKIHDDFLDETKESVVRNIIRNLRAICGREEAVFNKPLSNPHEEFVYYKPLINGVLRFQVKDNYVGVTLKPHSPDLFNTCVQDFPYDSKAGCPEFLKFLNEILGPMEIKLVQEWMGLSLIPINPTQKFMVFFGIGANGKSTLLKAHRSLVGEDNVSHVPLKDFLPNAKFGLILTEGKLLNIAEELDDYGYLVSSVLKNYVSQGEVPVQAKHQNIYPIKPTARLVFATNLLPRFKDESEGLTRRMIILPFLNQFLNPKDQDKRFIDDNYWLKIGELPGILNWAIKGLKDLALNDWCFTEPQSVIDTMDQYKRTTNPGIQFLKDYVEVGEGYIIGRDLYQVYARHCKIFNLIPEDEIAFGRLISKVFITTEQSKGTRISKDRIRSRYWKGITWRKDESDLPIYAQIAQQSQPTSNNLNELLKTENLEFKKGDYESEEAPF